LYVAYGSLKGMPDRGACQFSGSSFSVVPCYTFCYFVCSIWVWFCCKFPSISFLLFLFFSLVSSLLKMPLKKMNCRNYILSKFALTDGPLTAKSLATDLGMLFVPFCCRSILLKLLHLFFNLS
jgi:hypothetical protein